MLTCQEFLPHPTLRNIIHHYGVLEDTESYTSVQTQQTPPVINKGLMFHYRQDTQLIVDNGHFTGELPRGFILPQGTTPNVWKHKGRFGIFSIIFKPGKFRYLYPDSMFEFQNDALTFESFNDKSLIQLNERILTANDHSQRVQLADRFFLKKVRYIDQALDPMQRALRKMYLHPDHNIHQVKKHIYMSEGHFRRVFSRTFGISPKKLQQLICITYAINLINGNSEESLTRIGLDCGFYDQAHFTTQFKFYTGLTPSAFKKEQQSIAKLIAHRDKIKDGLMR